LNQDKISNKQLVDTMEMAHMRKKAEMQRRHRTRKKQKQKA